MIYSSPCEKARREAFDNLINNAKQLGANGIIGIRYDANEVMPEVTEVLC